MIYPIKDVQQMDVESMLMEIGAFYEESSINSLKSLLACVSMVADFIDLSRKTYVFIEYEYNGPEHEDVYYLDLCDPLNDSLSFQVSCSAPTNLLTDIYLSGSMKLYGFVELFILENASVAYEIISKFLSQHCVDPLLLF